MFGRAVLLPVYELRIRRRVGLYIDGVQREIQVDNFIDNQKKKILDRLQKRLEYEESSEFYHCGNKDCPHVKFDSAIEVFFKCSNCNEPLNMIDNSKIKEALRYKIQQISNDVSLRR